ncbi:sigma 54-interacting transcriptional regulator [Desulfogranum japonicum]|uniref:sigma 54-interacting transcriptional regulator n=1 Tax=Desulfogranum japonicum TaxID=231447 RepID=UPI00040BB5EB|nr:sigma 54-interacting transcriptional regulator [Desulfogranum japonicum]
MQNLIFDSLKLFTFLDHGMLVCSEHGQIIWANRYAMHSFNCQENELQQKNIRLFFPGIRLPLEQAIASETVTLAPCNLNNQKMSCTLQPITMQDRKTSWLLCFKEHETESTSSQSGSPEQDIALQMKSIIDSSSDGIWVCNGQGVVVIVNKASQILNGVKAEKILGRRVDTLVAERVFDQSVTTKVLQSGKQESILQHVKKTGRKLLCTATPVRDSQGEIFLIVVNERDLTELESLKLQCEHSKQLTERYKEEIREIQQQKSEKKRIIAESPAMQNTLTRAGKLATLGATNILILGDSGTGKGLLASTIHEHSAHREKPFIEINCAALPESLLEAELFGYERGAFTGASRKGKAGLVELAEGGTLFLDEIGDMPLGLQAKLLKYLDNGEFRRLGGTRAIQVQCSVISATNQQLSQLAAQGKFREDLFYRLNSFTLEIPPLRKRREDIPALLSHYLKIYNLRYGRDAQISWETMRILQQYNFPGNVRELKNIVKNGVVFSDEPTIDQCLLSLMQPSQKIYQTQEPHSDVVSLNMQEAVEYTERQVLIRSRTMCRTTREMAVMLGISQPSVVRKLKKHNL